MRDKHQAMAAAATSLGTILGTIRAQPKLPNILPTSNTETTRKSSVHRRIHSGDVSKMVSVGGSWVPVAVPLGAPDALVQAGGARFAAHARLLAAHSGYFKSVLGSRQEDSDGVLYVPNVSAQQFWPLLAYMYTGYLDLSPDNIYQVLLATHLLHMPRALDLCRNFLAQGRAAPLPPTPTTTIVKPIPSRKLPPFLSSNIFRPLFAENSLIFRSSPSETLFRLPDTTLQEEDKEQTPAQSSTSEDVKQPVAETVPNNCKKDAELSYDSSSSYISVGTGANDVTKTDELSILTNDKIITTHVNKLNVEEEVAKFKTKPEESKAGFSQNDDKVVIDIACCDGPVRFHRVLNRAYKNNCPDSRFKDITELTDSDDSYIEIEEDTRSKSENVPYDNCNAFSKSLQKQMNENIKTMVGKQNENRSENCFEGEASQSISDSNNRELPNSQPETIYTCIYCNHTFKSQYCYQKHARRHLNPVSIDAVNPDSSESCLKSRPSTAKISSTPGPRREVRLLDMNVQYYPCKTCGSKFPSYYFVHKHRKMCHAEELEGTEGNIKGSSTTEKKRRNFSNPKEFKSNIDINEQGSSKTNIKDIN
ncbi:uncharacterized protein LOC143920114 [Arctopsyche grandis]|uniref:uncharacterized protein LOC143920114 n=1 Tax=Arctopsyche grandis TaxID=121162 RepID=UPI00406D7CAA